MHTEKRPFYLRRGVQITVIVLISVFMATLVLLPYGIGYGIKRGILGNGGDRVTLTDVNFNPFTGTLGVYGLEVEAEGTRRLLLPRLDLRLRWLPLWKGHIVVEEITTQGIRVLIDWPRPNMLRVGGVLIDMSTSSPMPAFAIERLRVADSELEYRDSDLDTKARIEGLQLSKLTSIAPDEAATVSLDGLVDGARLKVQGEATPFAAEPRFDGKVTLEGLGLKHYAKLAAPDIAGLQGNVSLDTRVVAHYRQDSTLDLLQDGTLSLEGIEISAKEGHAVAGQMGWTGKLQLGMHTQTGVLRVTGDGRLALSQGQFDQGSQGARGGQDSLQWQGHISLESEKGNNKIATTGEFGLEGLRFSDPAQEMTVDQGTVKWGGEIEVESGPRQTRVQASGGLEARDLDSTVGDLAVRLASVELPELALDLTQKAGAGMDLNHEGELIVKSLEVHSDQQALTHDELDWKGRTELKVPEQGPLRLTTDGTLSSKEFDVKLKPRDVDLAYLALDWKGRLGLAVGEGLEDLEGSGTLAVKALHTDSLVNPYTAVGFDGLQAGPIEIQGPEQIAVAEIAFDRLTLGHAEQSASEEKGRENMDLFRSGRLVVTALDFSKDSGLKIDSIEERDVQSLTWRNREGEWNVVGLIQVLDRIAKGDTTTADEPPRQAGAETTPAKGPAQTQVATQDARSEGAALRVRVGKISVTGDTRAVFVDDGVDPPFQMEARLERAELRELDSTQPEHLSPLELEAVLDHDGRLRVSGGVAPFAPRLTLDIKAQIEGLPLLPLSSYTGSLIGYRMDSGEMEADIALQSKAGKLKGENKLHLYEVTVSRLSDEELKALDAKATVPLDTGLAVLKDKNNTIELDIPLSGDVDELEVDPGDVINQALAKGLQAGAKTYLAAALFPFGTALVVAEMAGKQAMKVRLDPVSFPPGSSTLNAKDHEYLDKVAKLLQDRPEIHVRVCGVATETDRTILKTEAAKARKVQTERAEGKTQGRGKGQTQPRAEAHKPLPPPVVSDIALRELAVGRAKVVEDYVVHKSGAKANRLIGCRPEIDKKDPKAKPRVDLLI